MSNCFGSFGFCKVVFTAFHMLSPHRHCIGFSLWTRDSQKCKSLRFILLKRSYQSVRPESLKNLLTLDTNKKPSRRGWSTLWKKLIVTNTLNRQWGAPYRWRCLHSSSSSRWVGGGAFHGRGRRHLACGHSGGGAPLFGSKGTALGRQSAFVTQSEAGGELDGALLNQEGSSTNHTARLLFQFSPKEPDPTDHSGWQHTKLINKPIWRIPTELRLRKKAGHGQKCRRPLQTSSDIWWHSRHVAAALTPSANACQACLRSRCHHLDLVAICRHLFLSDHGMSHRWHPRDSNFNFGKPINAFP